MSIYAKKNVSDYIFQLLHCELFSGISLQELSVMMNCLSMHVHLYPKGSVVFAAGQEDSRGFPLGIVLRGEIQLIRDDYCGNRTIIERVTENNIFGEAEACSGVKKFPVSVIASENCAILFGDYHKLTTTCSHACKHHSRLIKNMIQVLAKKNFMLTSRIESLASRTTRDKIMNYLSSYALKYGRKKDDGVEFSIPYNRQELADFLAVERSSMSSCLGKLKREGILDFKKNHFILFEQ